MNIRGHYEEGRYIPEPSVTVFEQFLGRVIAERPCAGCGLPRGTGPLRVTDGRFYHPECEPR